MNKYAIFVCASWNYVQWLNALLNSLEKRGIQADVHVMGWEMEPAYVAAIENDFSFPVHYTDIQLGDHDIGSLDEVGKNLFVKQSRFRYIQEKGKAYDAICMLDADMFVTSSNLTNLFDLVAGTKKLVGCEESIKWTFDTRHETRGEKIFPEPVRAMKFMCSVPIFFDLKEWDEVFTTYNDMAYHSWEMANGARKKRIGDIYCWSMSIYRNHRENDCILLPMHSMTQVHGTYGAFWCALQQHQDKWYCVDGCEVYTVHGRPGRVGWADSPRGWYKKSLEKHGIPYGGSIASIYDKSIRAVEREWYDLNFKGRVNLYDFLPQNQVWDSYA